jgi:hypothetical protein
VVGAVPCVLVCSLLPLELVLSLLLAGQGMTCRVGGGAGQQLDHVSMVQRGALCQSLDPGMSGCR